MFVAVKSWTLDQLLKLKVQDDKHAILWLQCFD